MIGQGLDYFPIKSIFFEDEKIDIIKREYGALAICILLKLKCKIYQEGCFYQWEQDDSKLLAKNFGGDLTPEVVNEVVTKLVELGYFDKKLFKDYHILTSEEIQSHFFLVVKGRKQITVPKEFLLVNRHSLPKNVICTDDGNTIERYVNKREEKSGNFDKTKGKESKVNERKESKERKEMRERNTHAPADGFLDFKEWIAGNAPWCYANLTLPTESQYEALIRTWKIDDIYKVIQRLENKVLLRCRYTSLFVTVEDWLERDESNKRVTRLKAYSQPTSYPTPQQQELSSEEERKRSLRAFRERLVRDAAKGSEDAKQKLIEMEEIFSELNERREL